MTTEALKEADDPYNNLIEFTVFHLNVNQNRKNRTYERENLPRQLLMVGQVPVVKSGIPAIRQVPGYRLGTLLIGIEK